MNIELSQYVNEKGTMVAWANAVVGKKELNEEQIAISEMVNKFALDIANSYCRYCVAFLYSCFLY